MNELYVISANRLTDGVVVWLAQEHQWVEALENAQVFPGHALESAVNAGQQAVLENVVVSPVAQPVELVGGGVMPSALRERLRATGPSVRTDLGKQAQVAGQTKTVQYRPIMPVSVEHAGIYRYEAFERAFLKERAAQFEQQVGRRLSGELDEESFKVYRLMNGLYLQLHGYMLRVAIPYGTLSAVQLRQLAYVADNYDKGYGHFTTRQNLQFNWPQLEETPEILSVLADADLHCIQTSGNCIRNVTTDHFAGAAADEILDPRVYAEILRQWSTDHAEFTYLPRKFKIAMTGSPQDRAAVRFHDIGIVARRNENGEVGFQIYAGGGLGRTPIVGTLVREWLPERELLRYVEAIVRVYNALGRRDNLYKARIKILVRELKPGVFVDMIEDEFARLPADRIYLEPQLVAAIADRFVPPAFAELIETSRVHDQLAAANPAFALWVGNNTHPHKQRGYVSVTVSLKPAGGIPGDISSQAMRALADLAEKYSLNELRVSHEQNLVLPHVRRDDLHEVWQALCLNRLATSNISLISDSIACPGMDYCSLATARSVPVAQNIAARFDAQMQHEIGELKLNVSGCINACAHHHVAHIGVLGLDKAGKENYQISLGGSAGQDAAVGTILGRSVSFDAVPGVVENIIGIYMRERQAGERFIDTYRRVGIEVFKEVLRDAA